MYCFRACVDHIVSKSDLPTSIVCERTALQADSRAETRIETGQQNLKSAVMYVIQSSNEANVLQVIVDSTERRVLFRICEPTRFYQNPLGFIRTSQLSVVSSLLLSFSATSASWRGQTASGSKGVMANLCQIKSTPTIVVFCHTPCLPHTEQFCLRGLVLGLCFSGIEPVTRFVRNKASIEGVVSSTVPTKCLDLHMCHR